MDLREVSENIYEIPKSGDMKVPARVYASEKLLEKIKGDKTLEQIKNVASLPGIQEYAIALPDAHQGYGFPIGGVAAVDSEEGVISPGGIGYDINCGVRVLRTNLEYSDVKGEEENIAKSLYRNIPCGLGGGGYFDVNMDDLEDILTRGMEWALDTGRAKKEDLECCEENGRLSGDPDKVPDKAKERGVDQVGSLGSGNHFLEVQKVADIFDKEAADVYGLRENQVLVMIHSGSRGLGHQTCTYYLREFEKNYPEIVNELVDKELIYAPLHDDLSLDYLRGMNAAANFAWMNRQAITEGVRDVLDDLFGASADVVYDVCHNIAKKEKHRVDGDTKEVVVHRKGATRAFPPGKEEVPEVYRNIGQPVLIPGSMGTHSYILRGDNSSMDVSFGSTAHGAGRLMSRTQAKNKYWGGDVQDDLEKEGIYVKAESGATIAEEAPGVYKDVDEVIRVSDELGIGMKVARMRPIANIKG